MNAPRIGSLFSGAGMLDEGVRAVLGGTVAWHSEVDPAACKVLAHRYPDVPNLGDVTAVDWSQVEPVDVITGGSPCQDVSHAGKRAGMRAGTRSGLWAAMVDAIDILRPQMVVFENVRGILSAGADSASDRPHPACICGGADRRGGVHSRRPGSAGADLPTTGVGGNDRAGAASPTGVSSRVGRHDLPDACADGSLGVGVDLAHDGLNGSALHHGDSALPADQAGTGEASPDAARGVVGAATTVHPSGTKEVEPGISSRGAADLWTAAVGEREGSSCVCPACGGCVDEANCQVEPCAGCVGDGDDGPVLRALGRVLGDLADLGYDTQWHGLRAADVGAPHGRFRVFVVATDANNAGRREHCGRLSNATELATTQRIRAIAPDAACDGRNEGRPEPARLIGRSDAAQRRAAPTTDAGCDGCDGHPQQDSGPIAEREETRSRDDADGRTMWGQYEPAIRRWEARLGRLAPPPTETAPKGGQRLSPRFTEWMLGWPDGWVTDTPGVSRNDALKICGNGVVPQQAAEALRRILATTQVAAA